MDIDCSFFNKQIDEGKLFLLGAKHVITNRLVSDC